MNGMSDDELEKAVEKICTTVFNRTGIDYQGIDILRAEARIALRTVRDAERARSVEDTAAIMRVLELCDGYMSTQPQDRLIGWNGGVMTWAELREHVQASMSATKGGQP